jgi:hypothetical protein
MIIQVNALVSVFPDIGSYAFLSDCETNALTAARR